MKCMGRLFRHFNDRVPDYDDLFVMKWLISRGEDLEYYSQYDVVVPKREYARTALARYNRPEDPFSDEVKRFYDIAGEWLWLEFGEHMCDSKVTSNDAVEQHLRDDKSPGAPWNLIGVTSKGEYFSNYAGFYAKYWEALSTSGYIRSLCSSSIKEELRTSEKVRNGQVRTIISMDVNHVKAHCQLTLDQNEKLMSTVGKHSSCIGLVQQYGGWNALDRRMSAFGPLPCTIELDGKQFDARFRYYCFQKIRDFRYRCLRREYKTKDNKTRFYNLYQDLCFGLFVDVDGHVYSRCVGNPSGQACTTPDNMFKNFMDIVVLWHLIMPESYHNYRDFHDLLILCIVGDDVNISVHPSIQHKFNAKAIFDVMSQIDMEYTTPCMTFRHNRDCEFLSHGFEECLGMMLPVIDCQKMRTSMLKFNVSGKVSETIIRACGLRNETFACVHCRDWFSCLLQDLRFEHGDSYDPEIVKAWKAYKTDAELWSLYTGLKYSDVCVALASTARSPEYKSAIPYIFQLQSQITMSGNPYVTKKALSQVINNAKKKPTGRRRNRKAQRKFPPRTALVPTVAQSRNQSAGILPKTNAPVKKYRARAGKSEVMGAVVSKERSLLIAQKQLHKAILDPWRFRAPCGGAGEAPCETIVGTNRQTFTSSTATYMFVFQPGWKSFVVAWNAASSSTALGTPATAYDAVQQPYLTTSAAGGYTQARPMVGGLMISVEDNGTSTYPSIYTGFIPSTSSTYTGASYDSFINEPSTYFHPAARAATCVWTPQDAGGELFHNAYLTAGMPYATGVPFIILTGCSTTLKITFAAIVQGDAVRGVASAVVQDNANPTSQESSKPWNFAELINGAKAFSDQAEFMFDQARSTYGYMAPVMRAAASLYRYQNSKHLLKVSSEQPVMVFLSLVGCWTSLTPTEIKSLIEDGTLEFLLKPGDYRALVAQYDPDGSTIYSQILQLQKGLSLLNGDDEKLFTSSVSSPVMINRQINSDDEQPLSRSTVSLAETLISRLGVRNAVTDKTASSRML